MKRTKLFISFFNSEKAGGMVLLLCTIISLLLANSNYSVQYNSLWHIQIGNHPLEYWINDGLMAVFFLLIGLELEREIYKGELSKIKEAILPLSGALGGMIIPAIIYLLFNSNTTYQKGFGIPMATDIAFAIGILSLLGNRIPLSLKIFLTALAVIDDLGAILMIALFYTKTIYFINLAISLAIFVFLLLLNRLKINNLIIYLIGGVLMWYFMLNSGVHATITGILLAFAIPFEDGRANSISYKLQSWLHYPVAFVVIPLFALCNTAIHLDTNWLNIINEPYSFGIVFGLTIGKPIGIVSFVYLSIKLKLTHLPKDINWNKLLAVGFLGGIGFTMSIFVTLLAFDSTQIINNSKIMILIASLLSGCIGYILLSNNFKSGE
ncbi:Na+/H+ antiporter NhaA [Flavobacterium sp.]|uniref:Na+/H+ antiporter NhaA n=1 Tax=Flavobacterium sp. TaxID=239 RepID=UPI0038D1A16E